MNAEIKFRFWVKDAKIMLYPDPEDYDFSNPYMYPLQYVGLKAKNGREIYVGDILSFDFTNKTPNGIFIGSVVFNNKAAKFEVNNESLDYLIYCTDDCHVIGNIYQNPGLIK